MNSITRCIVTCALSFVFIIFSVESIRIRPCLEGEALCGRRRYTPEFEQCIENRTVCFIGQVTCKLPGNYPTCYDPNTQECHLTAPSPTICYKNQKVCGDKCYNPESQECLPPTPDDPKTSYAICPQGQSRCGPHCYDPTVQQCLKDNISTGPCYNGQEKCGGLCYNPMSQTCIFHTVPWDSSLQFHQTCPITQRVCGYFCYNPTQEVCFDNGPTVYYALTCNIGYDRCGNTCYNPNTKECIDGGIVDK